MIHFCKDYFSVNFINFCRYLISLSLIWPLLIMSGGMRDGREKIKNVRGFVLKIIAITAVQFIFQITFTLGLFLVYPGLFTLLFQSVIIFSVFLALVLFPDERESLRNFRFLIGLLISVAGVVITISSGRNLSQSQLNLGSLLVIGCAACWALLSALIKKWLHAIPPTFSLSIVFTIVTPLFLFTYLFSTDGPLIPEAPLLAWILMFLSGIIAVYLGHYLHYKCLPHLGLALTSNLALLVPLVAGTISYFVFNEHFSLLRLFGGLLLISGAYIVIHIRYKQFPIPVEADRS